jgi:DNA-3-methyladenine glycosylase II
MPRHARGFDTEAAFAHLARSDRKLGAWMKKIGPIAPDPRWRKSFDPVDALARCDDATIRACGVSGNKLLALRDLALRESRGEIPDLRRMSTMDNDAIIAALVPVRGIGRWTVEMMLMFRLGRPDVLPVDDLGVRKGAQSVDKLEAMPPPKALLERGERWGPYRTYASLYLWRIADSAVKAKTATKRSQD